MTITVTYDISGFRGMCANCRNKFIHSDLRQTRRPSAEILGSKFVKAEMC